MGVGGDDPPPTCTAHKTAPECRSTTKIYMVHVCSSLDPYDCLNSLLMLSFSSCRGLPTITHVAREVQLNGVTRNTFI